MATEENWKEVIRSNYTELLMLIDTENGLRGELMNADIFGPMALKKFWGEKCTTTRISMILENLKRKDYDSFMKFCEVLEKSKQKHIVKYHLSSFKEISFTDSAPACPYDQTIALCQSNRNRLLRHWNELILGFTCNEEFLNQLECRAVLTGINKNMLKDTDQEAVRIERLLDLLVKGSENHFNGFCHVLEETKQGHIVKSYLKPSENGNDIKMPLNKNEAPVLLAGLELKSKQDTIMIPEAGLTNQAAVLESVVETFGKCSPEFLSKLQEKVLNNEAYKCDSQPRGRAIIINNKTFTSDLHALRNGAEHDGKNLEDLFRQLKFDTVLYTDITAQKILDNLEVESRNEIHQHSDMFVLFLLSHGISGKIYGQDSKPVCIKDIISLFDGKKCRALSGKPKLFFIQACQGGCNTVGVTQTDHGNPDIEKMMEQLNMNDDIEVSLLIPCSLPFESDDVIAAVHEIADIVVMYATVEGYVAYRRTDTGSFFVQCLIDILRKAAHEDDLESMLTKVKRRLHGMEVKIAGTLYKQIGETRSTLRKKLYLLP